MQDKKIVGEKIAEIRKEKGWKQADLAERLGVSDKTVSKWECGRSLPDIAMLARLAEVFGITSDELLGLFINAEEENPIPAYSSPLRDSLRSKGISVAEWSLMTFLIFAPLIAGCIIRLWSYECVPVHYDGRGVIDRWGSSNELVWLGFGLSGVVCILALIVRVINPKYAPKKELRIVVWVIIVMAVIYTVMSIYFCVKGNKLAAKNLTDVITKADIATPTPDVISIIAVIYFSFLIWFCSIGLPLLKPNSLCGLRTPATLSDDEIWAKTHEFSAWLMSPISVIGLMLCTFLKGYLTLFCIMISVPLVCAGVILYQISRYKKQSK